jgi:hypothetical protein
MHAFSFRSGGRSAQLDQRYRLVEPNRILNRVAYITKIQYEIQYTKKSRLCVTPAGVRRRYPIRETLGSVESLARAALAVDAGEIKLLTIDPWDQQIERQVDAGSRVISRRASRCGLLSIDLCTARL